MSNFVLKYLNPVDYFGIYYENGVRPDGRAMDQYRSIRTNDDCFKSAAGCFGSSSVQLGDTAVTCGINYSIGTPDVLTPSLGEVRVNVTLGSIASSSVSFVTDTQVSARGMQKSDTEHELESFLQKVLTASNLVDVGALLIQECQYALRLEVNLVVLSNSGNLQDACVLAMVRALRGVVVPVVEVDVSLQETSAINTNVRLAEGKAIKCP
jgi:exosome complex RNA-binding protein Rrp42 (RNase PH superfamily)